MSVRGQACAYCGKPAVHADHVIPRTYRKRLQREHMARECNGPRDCTGTRLGCRHCGGGTLDETLYETVPACMRCNGNKLTRLLIPPSWTGRLDELNDLGIGIFRVWHGDVRELAFTETWK